MHISKLGVFLFLFYFIYLFIFLINLAAAFKCLLSVLWTYVYSMLFEYSM
jgi:hypothetical protein